MSYRRDTDMAAEAMISEGGALRQPSQEESAAALAQARRHSAYHASDESPWRGMPHPLSLFLAGVGTGLVISLLTRGRQHQALACEAA